MFSTRKFTFGSLAVAAAVAALGLGSATQAATYTYAPSNGSTTWSSGIGWTGGTPPVSGASNTLTFVGTNTTVLANGLTNTNTDDISGGFQANVINLQGTGPASGAATINIAAASPSTGLDMVNNGTADPIINLNANAGTAGLTYNISAPITASSTGTYKWLDLLGSGTAAFNFSGGITSSASLSDNSSSTVTLSGTALNTFTGGIGTAALGAPAALNINANVVANGNNGVGGLTLANGTFTQGNSATVSVGTVGSLTSYAGSAAIGGGSGGNVATYTLNSGTLNVNVSSASTGLGLRVGNGGGTSGTLNVNGGTVNNYAEVAATSTTPATDALGTLYVAAAGTGTVNQNGGTVNTGEVLLGNTGSTAATYNLNGGTLATSVVYPLNDVNGGTGTSVFNFNGGTLQANAATPHAPLYGRFMQKLTAANVQSGGAIIDTNGQNIWIDQALLHSSSLGSTPDGGLTKNGAGTLTLTEANTYTGATTVAGGVLALSGNTGSLANSNITIDSGATLTGGASNSLGVLNFIINGNTANLITDNGTFNITDLSLVLNLTGTQTKSQYVLANYSGGTLLGSAFYSTTLVNGWSIDYNYQNSNEIMLVNANAAVPEPATLGLVLMGLVGGLVLLKRRRSV
ncbi:MAG: autotransporter-associated beta strand repeat-containing protein [Phycisphaerae bacterium]